MLTENEVVQKVVDHLESEGYTILQSLGTSEKGVDIIAEKDGEKLYVEAKGATSSKTDSSRFGKGFNDNQIKIHIAMAVFASMKVLETHPNAKAAIALPDNVGHRKVAADINSSLKNLKISIFWVSEDKVLAD